MEGKKVSGSEGIALPSPDQWEGELGSSAYAQGPRPGHAPHSLPHLESKPRAQSVYTLASALPSVETQRSFKPFFCVNPFKT